MRHVFAFAFAATLVSVPSLAQPTGATLHVSSLDRPIGITATFRFGREAIYVAQTGQGTTANGARIMVVGVATREVFPIMTGLATGVDSQGNLRGPSDVLVIDDDVWFTSSTSSTSSSLQRFSRANFTGSPPLTPAAINLTVNVGAFLTARGFTNTNPYALVQGPDGAIYFTDAGANALLRYDPVTAALTILATFPPIPNPTPVGPPMVDAVPTGVVAADGRFYVAAFTGFPFVEGLARVYAVEMDGRVSVHRGGLTALVDLAVDPRDGKLTAIQHGTFSVAAPSGWRPSTGRAIRLSDGRELASGFNLATGATYDASGLLHVATLSGELYRVASVVAVEQAQAGSEEVRIETYPNPTTGSTTLAYHLARPSPVRVSVYNALGREVAVVVDAERQAGVHTEAIDMARLAPGVYAIRLAANGSVHTRRLVVAR